MFQDMDDPCSKIKKGYGKILKTCQLARQAGLQYAWVDTCCIDKSSSAELTEAINSMFRWYQRSAICYVYFSDLLKGAMRKTKLRHCKWFTRGWTLQELIAPNDIDFFDQGWNKIASKCDLMPELAIITGINIDVLQQKQPLSTVSVAQKMAWSANRETGRVEDIAYCLLGIFGIYMPLIYGEEEHAFQRLQEEIIKTTPDPSIFAWRLSPTAYPAQNPQLCVYNGLLAKAPLSFSESSTFNTLPSHATSDFTVSNNGIKL